MEDPWSRMAGPEKNLMKGLSQDLYALADERQGVEMPTVEKVRWQQDGEALLAADDLAGLLEHLRRPFPAGMPKEYIWFLQARCWSRLGFVEAALTFMRAAGRTLPQAKLACLHYLVQLDKNEEAIRFGEPLLVDPSLRPGDVYYVASVLFLTARSLEGSTSPVVHDIGNTNTPRRSSSELSSATPHARDPTIVSITMHGISDSHATARRTA